jgi:hypothetical protein
MTWDELSFKSGDFSESKQALFEAYDEAFVELANRILKEKLDKAELVFNTFTKHEDGVISQKFQWDIGVNKCHTHTARLVCIEEIKK